MHRHRRPVDAAPQHRGFSRRAFLIAVGGIGIASACAGLLWTRRSTRSPLAAPAEPPLDATLVEAAPPEPPAPSHIPLPTAEPVVRVRVVAGREDQANVKIGDDGQWLRLYEENRDILIAERGTAMRGPLRVRIGVGGWSVIDAVGFRAPVGGLEPFRIVPSSDDGPPGPVRIGDREFPGYLRCVSRTDVDERAFDVVNHVPLEAYLPGVVSKELYNHWDYETHAAQAIAARSFACTEHAHFASRRHFDLTDGQSSQVYAGASTHRTSLDAVAATRGQVLAFEDHLVPGYYSSCCGGTAANASDAIGPNPINDIPPLRGSSEPDVCTSLAICRWQTQRPVDTLTERFIAYGKARGQLALAELGELISIEPTETNQHGRPTHYTITDVNGTSIELPAGVARRAANHREPGLHAPARPLRSGFFTATRRGDDFLIEGFGYGHGVGMCQHGAQLLARDGWNHTAILGRYYPGAHVIQAYT